MSRADRNSTVGEGERILAEWGVGDAARPADLSKVLGRDPVADLAVVHRLGAIATAESLALLETVERGAGDKQLRKEAKRALYRLAQRGFGRTKPAEEPPPPPLLAPTVEGYLSPVDGRGDQLVWLVRPRPGGVQHLFGLINDPDGMRETDLSVVTRKGLRGLRTELQAKHDLVLLEADWRYCDFLLRRAVRWTRERNGSMHGDYPALRVQILGEAASPDLPPLARSVIDYDAAGSDASLVAASEAVLDEPELRTWFFAPEEVHLYVDQILGVDDSPIVLTETQKKDRVDDVLARAVAELFGGDRREVYARRLEENAWVFHATRRAERARQAAAVALALRDPERGVQEIPFCAAMAQRSVLCFLQVVVAEREERARSSLLVTPQELARRPRR